MIPGLLNYSSAQFGGKLAEVTTGLQRRAEKLWLTRP
jgi:hypothetical protein